MVLKKQIIIVVFIFFFSGFLALFYTPSLYTFAENISGSDTTSSSDNAAQDDGSGDVLILREPLLPGKNTIEISNDSIEILSQYVSMVFRYVLALGAIIAVLVIMFGGIQIMISGGDGDSRAQAKEMILKTLSGIAMLFLTGLFLYAINPNFYLF